MPSINLAQVFYSATRNTGNDLQRNGLRTAHLPRYGIRQPVDPSALVALLRQLITRLHHPDRPVFESEPGRRLIGMTYNDYLRGGRGNDQLWGGPGNDLLAGGSGNDRLEGGDGHDRLYAGTGRDVLIGGNGNDMLVSDGISDRIDGGSGRDVAVLPGRFEDYRVRALPVPLIWPPRSGQAEFVFSQRKGGGEVVTSGIEYYRFSNETLSVDQLYQKMSVQPNTLALEDRQRIRLLRLLGFGAGAEANVLVFDMNRSGNLDAGDVAVVNGGLTGGEITRRTLTASDALAVTGGSTGGDIAAQLAENKEKWASLGVDDYQFRLQRNCFCPEDSRRPVDITVRNGEVVSARWPDGTSLPDAFDYNRLTVPELFDTIEDAIGQNAERIDVEWDPETGIPRELFIDYSSRMADEELGFTISAFQPLRSDNQSPSVNEPLTVVGFANRMPRVVPPNQPAPTEGRDYVLLGDATTYSSKPVVIRLEQQRAPVIEENGQYLARGLHFDRPGTVRGTVLLEDGSIQPLNIRVQFVY